MGIVEPTLVTLRSCALVTIRSALGPDAAAVVEAAKRIFASTDMVLTQPDEFTITVEDEATLLAKRADSDHGLYVIAQDAQSNIIAIAGLDPAHRRRAMHNVTLGIMVDEAWRGKGVGDALMKALMDWARANPYVRRVQLEVVATNIGAIRLYERHGFVTEGRRVACFQRQPGVFEDDLIMACDVSK